MSGPFQLRTLFSLPEVLRLRALRLYLQEARIAAQKAEEERRRLEEKRKEEEKRRREEEERKREEEKRKEEERKRKERELAHQKAEEAWKKAREKAAEEARLQKVGMREFSCARAHLLLMTDLPVERGGVVFPIPCPPSRTE